MSQTLVSSRSKGIRSRVPRVYQVNLAGSSRLQTTAVSRKRPTCISFEFKYSPHEQPEELIIGGLHSRDQEYPRSDLLKPHSERMTVLIMNPKAPEFLDMPSFITPVVLKDLLDVLCMKDSLASVEGLQSLCKEKQVTSDDRGADPRLLAPVARS